MSEKIYDVRIPVYGMNKINDPIKFKKNLAGKLLRERIMDMQIINVDYEISSNEVNDSDFLNILVTIDATKEKYLPKTELCKDLVANKMYNYKGLFESYTLVDFTIRENWELYDTIYEPVRITGSEDIFLSEHAVIALIDNILKNSNITSSDKLCKIIDTMAIFNEIKKAIDAKAEHMKEMILSDAR